MSRSDSLAEDRSYAQILKSTSLIGISSLFIAVIGLLRTKATALLLGPSGFGLMAVLTSIADLAVATAGMGIGNSGVRQIAEASGAADEQRIARTAYVVRMAALALGIIGALALMLASTPISLITFGTELQSSAIALLALAVMFRVVAAGQAALLQGTRRIGDLAAAGALGALLGGIATIIIVYVLRDDGIALSLVMVGLASTIAYWWYSRRIDLPAVPLTPLVASREAKALLSLGLAFMVSGMITMGAAYVVRLIVVNKLGLTAAGLYASAWTLAGLYVNVILQSMGADFYPRLVALGSDDKRCNQVVNEQTQVSILLAAPGVIATLVLAPLVIALLYSAKFAGAIDTLRWLCLGIAMRTITWPMGYIIVARNRQLLFVACDLAWAVVNVALTWACVAAFGLEGTGIAFFGSYVFHGLMLYPIVRWLSGFRWTLNNLELAMLFLATCGAAFVAISWLPPLAGIIVGVTLLVASTLYSIRTLALLVPIEQVPRRLRPIVAHIAVQSLALPLNPHAFTASAATHIKSGAVWICQVLAKVRK